MTTYLVIASDAVAGREDEFNAWYTDTHLGEVLLVPGIESARRFAKSSAAWPNMRPTLAQGYLALYEISRPAADVMADLAARTADGRIRMSTALDQSTLSITAFDALADWLFAGDDR